MPRARRKLRRVHDRTASSKPNVTMTPQAEPVRNTATSRHSCGSPSSKRKASRSLRIGDGVSVIGRVLRQLMVSMSVRLRLGLGDEKMDAVRALVRPVVVERIRHDTLADAIGGFRFLAAYADISPDHFEYIGKFSPTLAPECVAALRLGRNAQ